ncbi:hypothetical protein F4811DRAFT_33712 [Daldinia bambusicola]|nr:hypothetical protein F4811DRAFT_33712 [Daldinia bambusicola]
MRAILLFNMLTGFAFDAVRVSAMYMTPMPRQAATETTTATSTQRPDPWQCATQNLTQFFDVPKPTGALLKALDSYGDELVKPCLATATGLDVLSCSVTNTSQWCGFATAAPTSVRTAYSSYGKSVASWWSAKSSAAVSLSAECPNSWEHFGPIDQAWFNQTVAHAKCYDKAHPSSTKTTSTSGPTAKPGTGATTSGPKPTSTKSSAAR